MSFLEASGRHFISLQQLADSGKEMNRVRAGKNVCRYDFMCTLSKMQSRISASMVPKSVLACNVYIFY